ncbi:MAG: hypothetical protein IPF98_00450 [Gemmatimonadetes bacterium]|nr:hypothetical protein [Gemmatimonadota bacterium]
MSLRRRPLIVVAVSLLFLVAPLARALAQAPIPPAPADTSWKGGPFDRLSFRNIGPTGPSGRVDDLAVLERDPNVFYIAAATGGLWKTENGGTTLTPVFDSASAVSIGAVTIPTDDPNLVWVGTGENNNRQSSSWGDGVHKSTDGGKSWRNMGLLESRQVARIVIDPVDHDVVFVAALGDLWRAGGDRGIYKTSDGGLTWTRVLDVGPEAGGTDLVMDPQNNKVLYAATYQRRRASFGFNGGGPNSGLWKSTDAGRTWARLTTGLPDGAMGRIGLDVFRANPNIVYARVEHEKQGGVYRSDDAGQSWRKMGSHNSRPMYFGIIRVDPTNDLRVYLPETPLGISDDGGKTFRFDGAERIHVDHHAMWINPRNPSHMLIGNDGGVAMSRDKGRKWQWFPHLLVAQFYHASYDMQVPYNVCGGLQDNNSWCGPSRVRHGEGIGDHDWWSLTGGDGFVNLIDPTDARLIYTSSQEGYIARMDKVTGEQKVIRPEAAANAARYRWNWDTPFLLSPHNPSTVYIGGNRLFRSTDRGSSWTPISPDLTTAVDRDTLQLMGTRLKEVKLAKNDGVEDYGTLFTVAESRRVAGLIYTGSDDGQVHVTRDGGATWTNLTSRMVGVPRWAYVSRVEPSRFADGTVYVTFDAHRTGDYGSYLFASTDFGATFKSIAGTLPKGEVARSITEDQKNADVLYLGTETGLWVTLDRGQRWTRVRANLPTVPVYEITLHPRDNAMILATHGRGIWILDDLTPFQEGAKAQLADAHLYTLPPTEQQSAANLRFYFFQGDMQYLGPNPPLGAPIRYWLKTRADSTRVAITDGAGNLVRTLQGRGHEGRRADRDEQRAVGPSHRADPCTKGGQHRPILPVRRRRPQSRDAGPVGPARPVHRHPGREWPAGRVAGIHRRGRPGYHDHRRRSAATLRGAQGRAAPRGATVRGRLGHANRQGAVRAAQGNPRRFHHGAGRPACHVRHARQAARTVQETILPDGRGRRRVRVRGPRIPYRPAVQVEWPRRWRRRRDDAADYHRPRPVERAADRGSGGDR